MVRSSGSIVALSSDHRRGYNRAVSSAPSIVEFRQYTLHPGRREDLIELFDRELLDPQEDVGMTVFGQFRDLDDAQRFVFVRGFADMATRDAALRAFYGGPVWQTHRNAANATMIDSSDVLLLHPAGAEAGFSLPGIRRVATPADAPRNLYVATIHAFETPIEDQFQPYFERELQPIVEGCGARVLARFTTEHSPNTFPALPVREDENVFLWFAAFDGQGDYEAYAERRDGSAGWRRALEPFAAQLRRPIAEVRLAPTSRSWLR